MRMTKRAMRHPLPILSVLAASLFLAVAFLLPDRMPPRIIEDGRPLTSLVSPTDSSLVAVYDPANCFRCDALLPLLQAWATTAGNDRFALVLTRHPTEEEQQQMALLRIAPAGVIRSDYSIFYGRRFASELVLFVDGTEATSIPYEEIMSGMAFDPLIQYISESAHLSQEGFIR